MAWVGSSAKSSFTVPEANTAAMRVSVYIVEEQDILREAYTAGFAGEESIEVTGSASGAGIESIVSEVMEAKPDVVILGVKMLQPAVVEKVEEIRGYFPTVGIVLLSTLYDIKGIKQLREFAKQGSRGCAFMLKQSIDRIDQLVQVIHAVRQGQVILDPTVMEELIGAGDPKTAVLKELTHRELEILSWMAKGFNNRAIGEILCLEGKTVERHINNIYSKLNLHDETKAQSRHPRTSAIMLYLKAIGQLADSDFIER